MNLKFQWHVRQMLKALLTLPASFTFVLLALTAVRLYKFYSYGLGMFPTYNFPRDHTWQYELQIFWILGLSPLLPWLAASLPADIVIRRFAFGIYE